MSTITTKDGTEIYYKDWAKGPVVTFSHGWPLSSDAWDGQMHFLAQNGFRVVALDRRGHGRSSQASSGNDMNGYADDLAAVIEALDLKEATLVGHSTGGGEVARYIGRYGTKRVAKAVLVAAVPPIMLKSAANLEGLPMEVFDNLRSAISKDRSQFYRDLAPLFYGANRPGAKVSQGTLDQFWLWSMQAGLKNAYESIKAFSETDFTEDLKKFPRCLQSHRRLWLPLDRAHAGPILQSTASANVSRPRTPEGVDRGPGETHQHDEGNERERVDSPK
jgi:non-heme chloroperoxidase